MILERLQIFLQLFFFAKKEARNPGLLFFLKKQLQISLQLF